MPGWGYLTEFWDSVVEVVIGGTTYTVDWFQGIGNAVAGAIGGIFSDLTHHFYDIFYILEWALGNLGPILQTALAPLAWLFNFSSGFLTSATSTLENLNIETPTFSLSGVDLTTFFAGIPYFTIFTTGIWAILGILFAFYVIKKIAQI
jgi:hypothetical protein